MIKPNGAAAENGADYDEEEEEEDEGDVDDDDEYDDEYVEEEEEPNSLNKKRSIDEVVDEEASQGSKKIKAWQSKPPGALLPASVTYYSRKIPLKQPPEQVESKNVPV